jgi:signal transduction histidine kinase
MRLTNIGLALVPITAAAILLGLGLTRVATIEDLALIGAAVAALALGHVALRAGRQRAAAQEDAARMREQLELRVRVGECERRREHLAVFAQLAAHVSHEVRNPLSSISLNLELLDDELLVCACERGPLVRQLLGSVQAETARLQRLTDDYLAFAKPRRPERATEDLAELARDLVRLLREEALRSGVLITTVAPASRIEAIVDRSQVKQALLNLVRNAVQAAPDGGRVELRAYEQDGRACVSVCDTGPGIPEGDRCRVFEPFYTTKADGTGLGLPLALHIVREHGGELQVAAGTEGGAVVTMSFPLCPPHTPAQAHASAHGAGVAIEAAS